MRSNRVLNIKQYIYISRRKMTVKSKQLSVALESFLRRGEEIFAYHKKNGELRIARGTTCLDLIPVDNHPTGSGPVKTRIVSYWDTNVQGWRSFDPDNVVWVEDCAEAPDLTPEERNQIFDYILENQLNKKD